MNLQTDGFAPMLALWISEALPEPQAGDRAVSLFKVQPVDTERPVPRPSHHHLPTGEAWGVLPFCAPFTETQALAWSGLHSRRVTESQEEAVSLGDPKFGAQCAPHQPW